MQITEAITYFKKFTKASLIEMANNKLISFPLSNKDIEKLEFLHHFWLKNKWLKNQLRKKNIKSRRALIETCHLNKIETYIYSRYANQPENKKLLAKNIIREIITYYKLPDTPKTIYNLNKTIMRMKALCKSRRIASKNRVQN